MKQKQFKNHYHTEKPFKYEYKREAALYKDQNSIWSSEEKQNRNYFTILTERITENISDQFSTFD